MPKLSKGPPKPLVHHSLGDGGWRSWKRRRKGNEFMSREGPPPKETGVKINLAIDAQRSMAQSRERKLDTRNIIIAHSKEIFNGSYKLENLLTDSKKFKSLSALTSFLTSNFGSYNLENIAARIQENTKE